ncbi:MAG: type II secretion system protein [Bacilli bacterium]|nr:type II secretion system protein [Bacilli bacterium]
MDNEKGFTLVEVLAVVAILLAVLAIIVPKVIKPFSHSEETIYNEQINTIIEVSKLYMSRHTELLPDSGDYIITFDELNDDGLIKGEQVLNPRTKRPLTGCVVVHFENNKYIYEYTEGTVCDK